MDERESEYLKLLINFTASFTVHLDGVHTKISEACLLCCVRNVNFGPTDAIKVCAHNLVNVKVF